MENEPENTRRKKSSYQRKLRYRDLLNTIEGLHESEDVGLTTVNQLGNIFKEVNILDGECEFEERVEYADETLLESVVLSSASGILVKCIQNLEICPATYEANEFSSKIINEIKDPEEENLSGEDLLKLLQDAREVVLELPNYAFLYGACDPTKIPEPKLRKERAKKEVPEKVEKKQLQRVENLEKDEENIEDTVNFLVTVLAEEYEKNDHQPVSYFAFVVDSDSFSSTVENMFYTSFLVRDGKAQLDIDDEGIPILKPMRKSDLKHFRNDGGVNLQRIPSITMDDWKVFKKHHGFLQKRKQSVKSKS